MGADFNCSAVDKNLDYLYIFAKTAGFRESLSKNNP